MKDCPSCGLSVPSSASRCKSCFHDFAKPTPSRSFAGPLALLASFVLTTGIAVILLLVVLSRPLDHRILVDAATQSIVFTTQYRSGVSTERVSFADVANVEYAITRTGNHEVAALTRAGGRHVIQQAQSSLSSDAKRFADVMGKPLIEVDHTHKPGSVSK